MSPLRAALAVAFFAAAPAQAVTLTFAFEGVVTSLVRDGGLFGAPGSVQLGDPFTGHVTYEVGPANPDQLPADLVNGRYDLIELVVDQSVLPPFDPILVGVIHQPGLPTIPPAPADDGRDLFLARATSVVYPSVAVRLEGPFGSAFSDDSLPLALDLADFSDGAFVQGLVAAGIFPAPSIEDVGQITSLVLVPEPTSLALAALGLALLARRRAYGANASSVK
jgi:hypothetical protein